ncbi:MAG TPA: DUF1508 domain-containing protein [Phycisphaerales bacterium]|nr:DUF1508 domain-containing protein [Phycisphaerales bacterium]
MSTFELKVAKDGGFYFNLTGSVPRSVLLSGEKHPTREAALHAIDRVKRNAVVDERYEKRVSGANRHFFVLNGDDGQALGTSARFETEAERDSAVGELKRAAPEAKVDDRSGS